MASWKSGAVRRDVSATSVDVLDVAVGVCWRGRVRLSGHDPSERREGRVDAVVDVDELVLVLFAHA